VGQPLSYLYLGNRQHRCANTSDSSAKEGLLTAQACPLSEASLSRQQVFGTFCAKALADCILCCWSLWILQLTAVLCCHVEMQTEYIEFMCFAHSTAAKSRLCFSPVLPVHCCRRHQSAISSTVAPHSSDAERCSLFLSFSFLFSSLLFSSLLFSSLLFSSLLFSSLLFFSLFTAVSLHAERCVDWPGMPHSTGQLIQRPACSTVAMCRLEPLGHYLRPKL